MKNLIFVSDIHLSPKYPKKNQLFREKFLRPAFQLEGPIKIILDGARGYGSSFLEEAFGGLVREGFSSEDIIKRTTFVSKDPTLVMEIEDYLRHALDVANE